MPNKEFFNLLLPFIAIVLLSGCSAERTNVFSTTYHNTTARYNAYYYAKKRLNEIEAVLKENYDNDYNRILNIYPEIDSTLANSYQEQIDDCIKKASIGIQRHKNSKWVDDCYVFIGRARHYSLDYVNAIETYKYVNTKSEDDDARHEALARLLRTFVDYKEYDNAVAVDDYLKKEDLSDRNKKILYLNKAHYFQTIEDYGKMVENLVLAVPLLKRKDGKGRIYFIIGQVYQKLGFDAEAFNYYRKCLASNPAYELDFYTRLNMAQVTQLGKSSDVKSARKLLSSLLKDPKNEEYKDRIYYEMAEFEFKQNNLTEAVEYFKSSTRFASTHPRQRGQAFLRLGEVHYDSLKSYELAQAYYDSAVQSLPDDFENIEAIRARNDILAEFVKHLNTITLQDSLLALAQLDSVAISERLNRIVEEEKAAEEKQKKKEERQARRAQFNSFNDNSGGINSTGWYFGNPSAVAQGQSEFIRIWGNRKLEDNWRRRNKATASLPIEAEQPLVTVIPDGEVPSDTVQSTSSTSRYDELYSAIPFTELEQASSLHLIEESYYRLGNIYKFDLEEDDNAANSFTTLIKRFPESEHLPEALYQIYLLLKEAGNTAFESYKSQLLIDFPNSIYAKLIANPNYREESTAANDKLKAEYENAYALFSQQKYDTALYVIQNALNAFDETVFTANMDLLRILIVGKTEDISLYQYELGEFIKNYPDSEVKPYAEKLLDASRSYQERKQKRLGTAYVKYLEQSHYFVYLYETKSKLTETMSAAVNSFNEDNGYDYLKTSNLILNDNYAMILVSDFEDKIKAYTYFSAIQQLDPANEAIRNSKFYKFVITKDNFNIFYQSKDFETYLTFFEKNYINGIN